MTAPEVRVVSSVVRGKAPEPGIRSAAFVWRDVVNAQPPRRRSRGAASHTTYHFTEISPDVRISLATQVRVDPGNDLESPMDDVILVDERICVQRRALQELVDRERAFSDHLASRWRGGLTKSLVTQRRWVNTLRLKWAIAVMLLILRIEAKVGLAFIRGTRVVLRSFVAIPDTILSQSASAQTRLSSRANRRSMWRAVSDPSGATNEEKGALIVVLAFSLVVIYLVATQFIIVFDEAAPYFRAFVGDFLISIASVLALPFPSEVVLLATFQSFASAGVVVACIMAFSGFFAGKVVGSWFLFLVGDSLHETVEKATRGRPRLKARIERLQASANRTGFWWLILINAMPFVPDILVAAFALSGMRFRAYIGGIAIGSAIKYGGFVMGFALIGSDTINAWLDLGARWIDPLAWPLEWRGLVLGAAIGGGAGYLFAKRAFATRATQDAVAGAAFLGYAFVSLILLAGVVLWERPAPNATEAALWSVALAAVGLACVRGALSARLANAAGVALLAGAAGGAASLWMGAPAWPEGVFTTDAATSPAVWVAVAFSLAAVAAVAVAMGRAWRTDQVLPAIALTAALVLLSIGGAPFSIPVMEQGLASALALACVALALYRARAIGAPESGAVATT